MLRAAHAARRHPTATALMSGLCSISSPGRQRELTRRFFDEQSSRRRSLQSVSMTTSITSYSSLASPLVVTASGAAAAAKDLATGAASAAKQRLLSALSTADLNGASSKERLLTLVQSTVERTRWRRSRLPGPDLLRVLDDDDGTDWALLHVLAHLDFPSLARFALTNSDAAGAVRCALLDPELKTVGLSTWHTGCGYG